jgi:hypothetical protein
MDDSRLPKVMMFGELHDGIRGVGGQLRGWRSGLKQDLTHFKIDSGRLWMTVAKDAADWHTLVDEAAA